MKFFFIFNCYLYMDSSHSQIKPVYENLKGLNLENW